MTTPRFYLSRGASVHEHEENFYILTLVRNFKINRTIATFLGLLNEPKSAQELVDELQGLIEGATAETLNPLVSKFLKDMYRLEIIRREGDTDLATLTQHFHPGDRVGQYVVDELLSLDDQFVQLYRATDAASGERVVLKMFSHTPEGMGDNQLLQKGFQQFQQEFDIMGALPAHPHICALRAYHTEPYHYAVLEYLPGDTLSNCLKKGTLGDVDKGSLATQILLSLAHVHAQGIVHGDIHSRNFMIDGEQATMIDFGFAYRVGVSEQEQLINRGGAASYLSPERINQHHYKFSKQAADFRAEVYQIALVLFKLYHNELPFDGVTWKERAASIISYDFSQHLSAAIPHEQVLLRALDKDPDRRYAGGQELLAAWQQAVESPAAVAA